MYMYMHIYIGIHAPLPRRLLRVRAGPHPGAIAPPAQYNNNNNNNYYYYYYYEHNTINTICIYTMLHDMM